ncbi:Uncharacterised protein [Segatella copri]|nr:Uncharacterised protein [Segatella copri]
MQVYIPIATYVSQTIKFLPTEFLKDISLSTLSYTIKNQWLVVFLTLPFQKLFIYLSLHIFTLLDT